MVPEAKMVSAEAGLIKSLLSALVLRKRQCGYVLDLDLLVGLRIMSERQGTKFTHSGNRGN